MSLFLSRIARSIGWRIVLDPQTRDNAAKAARGAADEARLIVRDEDPARAAGRSVRRLLNKWQSDEPREAAPPDKAREPRDDG